MILPYWNFWNLDPKRRVTSLDTTFGMSPRSLNLQGLDIQMLNTSSQYMNESRVHCNAKQIRARKLAPGVGFTIAQHRPRM